MHQHNHSHDFTYKVEKGKEYNITINVTVPYVEYNSVFEGILSEMAEGVKIPGFRPGKAPKSKIAEVVGSKAASHALDHLLPEITENILNKEDINPITQVQYSVDALSVEDGLKFSIIFVEYPEVKLANLEKLKVKSDAKEVEVTDQEILDVINRLLNKKEEEKLKFEDITDEMAKDLKIDEVSSVSDLKEKISNRLKTSKETERQRKFEDEVMKAAIEASTIPLPALVIDTRISGMVEEYKSKIAELNVNLEDFLKAQGLTEESLREQKKVEAEQSLKQEMLLNEVAKKYNLIPELADVDAEINAISDANTKAQLQTTAGRRFVMATLLQQRSFNKLLEIVKANQK